MRSLARRPGIRHGTRALVAGVVPGNDRAISAELEDHLHASIASEGGAVLTIERIVACRIVADSCKHRHFLRAVGTEGFRRIINEWVAAHLMAKVCVIVECCTSSSTREGRLDAGLRRNSGRGLLHLMRAASGVACHSSGKQPHLYCVLRRSRGELPNRQEKSSICSPTRDFPWIENCPQASFLREVEF
jgi:hypothetical protein